MNKYTAVVQYGTVLNVRTAPYFKKRWGSERQKSRDMYFMMSVVLHNI